MRFIIVSNDYNSLLAMVTFIVNIVSNDYFSLLAMVNFIVNIVSNDYNSLLTKVCFIVNNNFMFDLLARLNRFGGLPLTLSAHSLSLLR